LLLGPAAAPGGGLVSIRIGPAEYLLLLLFPARRENKIVLT